MRQIKFRGKVLYNGNHFNSGEWVMGSLILKDGAFIYVADIDELGNVIREGEVEVDFPTVGQFTGMTDKNGIEIYEGDITNSPLSNICEIRWCTVSEYAPSPKPFMGKDLFEYTGFAMWNIKQQRAYHMDTYVCENEIIGNIHDKNNG